MWTTSSLDAFVKDVEAVVDRFSPDKVDLVATFRFPDIAVAYAAACPGRLRRLVLWSPMPHRSVLYGKERFETLLALAERDWELAIETFAHAEIGWSQGNVAHSHAALMRASVSQADFLLMMRHTAGWDISPCLPQISAPTLVVQFPGRTDLPEYTKLFASRIESAKLVRLGPVSVAPYVHEEGMRLVEEFLGLEVQPAPEERGRRARRPHHPLHGPHVVDGAHAAARRREAARSPARAQHDCPRGAGRHGGTEIKHTGDGIMASFASASGALDCAIAVQRGVAERDDANLAVHVGLNAGEPIADERDLFGTSVDLARRMCDQAEASEIMVWDVVRQLAAGKEFLFSDRGVAALKGFDEPVRLFEVRWRED